MRTCSLVRMRVVRIRKDVPSFTCVLFEEEKICQSVMLLKNAAMMSFWLVLPKDDDFRLNLHVERRGITSSNRSVAQRVLNADVEADRHRRYHVWVSPVRRPVTVALRGGALRVLRSLRFTSRMD